MVPVEVRLLLAVFDPAPGAVVGQLLPGLCRRAAGVDLELCHAAGCPEAAAVGALEHAEHTPQRECHLESKCCCMHITDRLSTALLGRYFCRHSVLGWSTVHHDSTAR